MRALDPVVCAGLLRQYPEPPDYSAGSLADAPPADLPGGTRYTPEALQGWATAGGRHGEVGGAMVFSVEPGDDAPGMTLAEALAACRALAVEEEVPQK
ncbi:MAG: hypothetical protein R3D02_04095 [Hyphomicrobiales bacterium]